MSDAQGPAEAVTHAIRLCRRGILCHGEMWRIVLDKVCATGAPAFLDGLPPDVQGFLREAIVKQPESFASGVGLTSAEPEVAAAVKRWCGPGRSVKTGPAAPGALDGGLA